MAKTAAEKLLSKKAGRNVKAGEFVVVDVDFCVASDTTAPLAIKAFDAMFRSHEQQRKVYDPQKIAFVIDHASPAPNAQIANLHRLMRQFCKTQKIAIHDVGEGILHHLVMEKRYCKSGDIVLGADSHTVTYGAWNAFAVGVGSTDLAGVMKTGKTWLKVPASRKVILKGETQPGVYPKDVILFVLGKLGLSSCNYQAVEFSGTYVESLSLAGRITLANMVSEMGGKVGLVNPKGLNRPDLCADESKFADPGASYVKEHLFDVSCIKPQIALPGSPADNENLKNHLGKAIDVAFIGTCTNTRIEDLREVARILKGNKVAEGVRLMVAPASRQVLIEASKESTLETILSAGGTLLTPGCGPCVGTHQGVPGDNEVVISAANRNFAGRMGNRNAQVILASPATVAASAVKGFVCGEEQISCNP